MPSARQGGRKVEPRTADVRGCAPLLPVGLTVATCVCQVLGAQGPYSRAAAPLEIALASCPGTCAEA
eukprot:11116968-Lingulodinium_polyedra.AAC.1